jgi:hypothetical protein
MHKRAVRAWRRRQKLNAREGRIEIASVKLGAIGTKPDGEWILVVGKNWSLGTNQSCSIILLWGFGESVS